MNIEKNDAAMSYFVHHVVGLVWYKRVNGEREIWHGSAFPIVVRGQAWLATAGHNVRDIEDALAKGELERVLLIDSWAGSDGTGRPIIHPVKPDDLFVMGSNLKTLDLGAIRLDGLAAEALRKSKTAFIERAEWSKRPRHPYDHYFVLGMPGEMVEKRMVGEELTGMFMPRGLFHLQMVDRPSTAEATRHGRFYGLISRGPEGGRTLKGIEGVSGGPVLAGRNVRGGVRLEVLAVQTAWLDQSKVVVGDYLWRLGEALARHIRKKRAKRPNRNR